MGALSARLSHHEVHCLPHCSCSSYGYPAYYLGKRSADAEPEAEPKADPFYYGAYGYGYPYAHYSYPAYYLGKRSADAEPAAEPKADPYYVAYGYGYAGYPYAHYSY